MLGTKSLQRLVSKFSSDKQRQSLRGKNKMGFCAPPQENCFPSNPEKLNAKAV